jgi:hypothetical protein
MNSFQDVHPTAAIQDEQLEVQAVSAVKEGQVLDDLRDYIREPLSEGLYSLRDYIPEP